MYIYLSGTRNHNDVHISTNSQFHFLSIRLLLQMKVITENKHD